jgi:hypothetical protein
VSCVLLELAQINTGVRPNLLISERKLETLQVHLFKHSSGPFISLLNEHGVKYQLRGVRLGVPMNGPDTLEIMKVIGSATFWPAVATVVVAFINRNKNRKVIVTTRDNTAIHLEGMSTSEVEMVLQKAESITAIAMRAEND